MLLDTEIALKLEIYIKVVQNISLLCLPYLHTACPRAAAHIEKCCWSVQKYVEENIFYSAQFYPMKYFCYSYISPLKQVQCSPEPWSVTSLITETLLSCKQLTASTV